MSNNSRLAVAGKITYSWNPFQDNVANRVTDETASTDVNAAGIIIPRNGPFFSRNFKIKLKSSGRELDFNAGDYTFIYPFGSFTVRYNRLVWAGIQVKGISGPTDFIIEYDTIGGDFVLSDLAYAEAVANALTSPRTIDWSEITDLPKVWAPDPHDHPASDTMNYTDMMVWMKSYLDVLMENPSTSWLNELKEHLDADLKHAHKSDLEMLGIMNLKDWPMAVSTDIKGNSTEVLINMAILKEAIRGYSRGDWS